MAFFEHNGVQLYYEAKGDTNAKSAVAFFNGVMASTNSWDYITPVFEKLGFQIICHDFQGQLKSDKPAGPYSFAQHAAQAKALFEHLGVERVHIIGTSYGSEVGMRFSMLYPELVKSLCVIDGVSETDEVMRAFVESWSVLCDLEDGEKFFWGMAPSIYGSRFYSENLELLKARAQAFRSVPREYYEGQKILYRTFLDDVYMTDRLHEIKAPTLVVVGQDDILKPVKFSDILAREIPNSEYVRIPDCGHVAIFESWQVLQSILSGFVLKND